MPSQTQNKRALVAGGVLIALVAGGARAAEWVLEPGVGGRMEYSDNMYFSTQNKRSGTITSIGPGLRASRNGESSTFGLNAGFGYSHNTATTPSNYTNWLLGANGRYTAERTVYNGDLSLVRDSTLSTELFRTGLVQNRVQRNYSAAGGSIVRTLTERLSGSVGVSGAVSRYDKTGDNGLSDNNYVSANTGLTYQLSTQTAVTASVAGTRYRATTFDNEDKQVSGNLSVAHTYSEKLKFFAGGGYYTLNSRVSTAYTCLIPALVPSGGTLVLVFQQFSPAECQSLGLPLTQTRPAAERTSHGQIFDAGFTWQLEPTTTLTGSARQGFNPSGVGTLVKTTSFGLNLGHQFSERMRGSVDALMAKSQSSGIVALPSGTFYTLLATLSYRFAPQWTVDGGYRHTLLQYKTGGNANANAVFVTFRYDFQRIAVSR